MALNSSMGLGFIFTARDLASAKMQKLEHRFASLDERVLEQGTKDKSTDNKPGSSASTGDNSISDQLASLSNELSGERKAGFRDHIIFSFALGTGLPSHGSQ